MISKCIQNNLSVMPPMESLHGKNSIFKFGAKNHRFHFTDVGFQRQIRGEMRQNRHKYSKHLQIAYYVSGMIYIDLLDVDEPSYVLGLAGQYSADSNQNHK